jgi:hypothetical protein
MYMHYFSCLCHSTSFARVLSPFLGISSAFPLKKSLLHIRSRHNTIFLDCAEICRFNFQGLHLLHFARHLADFYLTVLVPSSVVLWIMVDEGILMKTFDRDFIGNCHAVMHL